MRRITYAASLALLALFSLISLPGGASARELEQAQRPETVTMQVDATTPSGIKVTGTVLIMRYNSATTRDEISFTGMVNGVQASMSATGTEVWNSDGTAGFNITTINEWKAPVARPAVPMGITFAQPSSNVATLNGVPVAMSGPLKPPGSGSFNLTVANPGQGSTQVVLLPKTGDGPALLQPAMIVAMLVVPGLALIVIGAFMNRRAPRGARVVK